jgi:hypothetical protein
MTPAQVLLQLASCITLTLRCIVYKALVLLRKTHLSDDYLPVTVGVVCEGRYAEQSAIIVNFTCPRCRSELSVPQELLT